jgi:hypothetical protein
MRTMRLTMVLFVAGLFILPANTFAAPRVQVGLKQVKVTQRKRVRIEAATHELYTATVSRRHEKASTADLSARRAIGKLARSLEARLVAAYGDKGKAIAGTMQISANAEFTENWRNQKVDRAAYKLTVRMPLARGHKRARAMMRDTLQEIMKPEWNRWDYRSQGSVRSEKIIDDKAVNKAIAAVVSTGVENARAIAKRGLKEAGRPTQLEGADISAHTWSWRGPQEVDVTMTSAFGFQAKTTKKK